MHTSGILETGRVDRSGVTHLYEKVMVPNVGRDERQRDEMIAAATAEEILESVSLSLRIPEARDDRSTLGNGNTDWRNNFHR